MAEDRITMPDAEKHASFLLDSGKRYTLKITEAALRETYSAMSLTMTCINGPDQKNGRNPEGKTVQHFLTLNPDVCDLDWQREQAATFLADFYFATGIDPAKGFKANGSD